MSSADKSTIETDQASEKLRRALQWPVVKATTTVPPQSLSMSITGEPGPQPDPSLSKEQAMADTIRALKECYPDRWERVWHALWKESAADAAVEGLAK